jgi:hypothetical protein
MALILGTIVGLILVFIPEPATTAAGAAILLYLWTDKLFK